MKRKSLVISASIAGAIILIILLTLSIKTIRSSYSYTDSRFLMGTQCTITVYDRKDVSAVDDAFTLLEELDKRISRTRNDSEVSEINQMAGLSPVEVSEDTYSLIKRAMELSKDTGYAFNPLMGALTDLWGIGTDSAKVPSDDEITYLLQFTTPEHIVLDDSSFSVFLTDSETSLDLGGIGKGYASDQVAALLRENGVERSIINLGGNIYCIGSKTDSEEWVVGLQNPESDYGGYYATVDVTDSAVITSGGYQRFSVEDGKVYQHVLDPSTGWPSDSDLLSATVISSDATAADALSTAIFVLGEEKGREILASFGMHGVMLTKELEIIRL